MLSRTEVKQCLRLYDDYDDSLIDRYILASEAVIYTATGVRNTAEDDITDESWDHILNLYRQVQQMIIVDLYNEVNTENRAVTSLLIGLELEYRRYLDESTSV